MPSTCNWIASRSSIQFLAVFWSNVLCGPRSVADASGSPPLARPRPPPDPQRQNDQIDSLLVARLISSEKFQV